MERVEWIGGWVRTSGWEWRVDGKLELGRTTTKRREGVETREESNKERKGTERERKREKKT